MCTITAPAAKPNAILKLKPSIIINSSVIRQQIFGNILTCPWGVVVGKVVS